jgi:hypothetical protein
MAIRYVTGIALSYRNDSSDTVGLRYRGTICTAFPMTRTVSYDTYLVSYDTNLYADDDELMEYIEGNDCVIQIGLVLLDHFTPCSLL